MDSSYLQTLIEAYRTGYPAVLAALSGAEDGADRSPLDRVPPSGWTARQVVHHLADSETHSYVRLRRLLAEPSGTTIQGYDEAAWARELPYNGPIAPALRLLGAVRDANGALLEHVVPADLNREGVHTESGQYTVLDWLRTYTAHCHEHAEQISRALEGLD